jgi:hypothetical protein
MESVIEVSYWLSSITASILLVVQYRSRDCREKAAKRASGDTDEAVPSQANHSGTDPVGWGSNAAGLLTLLSGLIPMAYR